MQFKSFTLDRFQEEAILSIDKNNSVVVSAPTGSGKTLIADYIIDKCIKEGRRAIYTAPIKALSNQKYKDFTDSYGEDRIGLVTGDIVVNPQAQILIMTTEVYRNMAIIKDPVLEDVSYCIMDEIHFISDEERGYVWEESIIFSPEHIRFLFLSATIPNAMEFAGWIEKIKGGHVDVIMHGIRPVPLEIRFYDADLGITTLRKIGQLSELDRMPRYNRNIYSRKKAHERAKPVDFTELIKELGDRVPCIYFVFSRAKTQEYAHKLAKKMDMLNHNEKKEVVSCIQEEFRKLGSDVLSLRSTPQLKECLLRGVGFHHAGLLPDIKHIVEKLFSLGLIKVLFATETFAVGINMPAKTVCFDSLRKYTGTGFRYLNSKEFFQISGRAGRRGIDRSGLAVAVIHRQGTDLRKVEEITGEDTMPIQSQFRLSYNTVLNMVNLHTPEQADRILRMNFYTFQKIGLDDNLLAKIKGEYDGRVRTLEKLGYIQDGQLTNIGLFTTKIYSNELELSQIFNSGFKLDEYKMMLLIAALSYEERRDVVFHQLYKSKEISELVQMVKNHPFLRKNEFWRDIYKMTGIIYPLMQRKSFIEILKNTNMVEGDLMRLLMQTLDRLEQVDRAVTDHELSAKVRNCKRLIRDSLEGIGIF